jgi:hypothetical protein
VPPRAAAAVAVAAFAVGGAAGSFVAAPPAAAARSGPVSARLTSAWVWPVPGGYAQARPAATHPVARRAGRLPHVILPDLFAVAPRGITAGQLRRLSKLRHVRGVIAVDGGGVRIKGREVSAIGVSPAGFRSWEPPQTAARQGIWTALGRGELLTSAALAKKLGLHGGSSYRVSGARQPVVRFGGTAAFGIPGVDAVVNSRTSRSLGLLPHIGVLISAPRASLAKLDAEVGGVLGAHSKLVNLRSAPHIATGGLPVDRVSVSRPRNYLELYQASAARYCPGLSWTVLAAIGQIESGDGQNMGPSSAGALGPMQFLPSTWARWGIDAFGETGRPNIMDPFDAVPAAADYLCSYGAGQDAAALSAAIFGYNHASWYVAEVLALAHEYAQEYG